MNTQGTPDPTAVTVVNAAGAGRVVLLCEHASARFPQPWGALGLSADHQRSHAAWDPGAEDLARALSAALDAALVLGRVSRLIYDCNRPPDNPTAMPTKVEDIPIPGNEALSEADKALRIDTVYTPFCEAVTGLRDARNQRGQDTVLVTVHSFTPVYFGVERSVQYGILHDADTRLADAMLARADLVPDRIIQRNEPYGPADGVTHSLKLHGIANGWANVMLEVRNDLLTSGEDVARVAEDMLTLLAPAVEQVVEDGKNA